MRQIRYQISLFFVHINNFVYSVLIQIIFRNYDTHRIWVDPLSIDLKNDWLGVGISMNLKLMCVTLCVFAKNDFS